MHSKVNGFTDEVIHRVIHMQWLHLALIAKLAKREMPGELWSNAGKYSCPDSEITIEIEPGQGEAVVSVTNLGAGIQPEDAEKLFTRFYRTSRGQQQAPGLGLGLYITKGLVEAHGGRIWVKSEPDKYATFSFTLPAVSSA